MNFWASGFWAEGFWATGFWGEDTPTPPSVDEVQAPCPGAAYPMGSSEGLIRLRRKRRQREADLLLLGL